MNEVPPGECDIDNCHFVERLAAAVADRLAPTLPLSIQLWNAKTIAAYLQRSPAVVLERVVTLPGFPSPIRLPSTRAASKNDANTLVEKSTGQPLWKAVEVISWTDSYREHRVGRPRARG